MEINALKRVNTMLTCDIVINLEVIAFNAT